MKPSNSITLKIFAGFIVWFQTISKPKVFLAQWNPRGILSLEEGFGVKPYAQAIICFP